MNDTMKDYPALDRTPAGNPVKPVDDSDIKAKQAVHDPDHIEVTHHGNMTVARDVSPPLPLRGPTPMGENKTNSTYAQELQRHLDAACRS